MKLAIPAFKGLYPGAAERLMPDGSAVSAEDCRFKNGALVPFRAHAAMDALTGVTGPHALYRYTHLDGSVHWIGHDKPTTYARGPIANDKYDRLYYANADGFFVLDNTLGAPADMTADAPDLVQLQFISHAVGGGGAITYGSFFVQARTAGGGSSQMIQCGLPSNVQYALQYGSTLVFEATLPNTYPTWDLIFLTLEAGVFTYRKLYSWDACTQESKTVVLPASEAAFLALSAQTTPTIPMTCASLSANIEVLGDDSDPTTGISRSFVVTYVNAYGEETAPLGYPTPSVTFYPGGSIGFYGSFTPGTYRVYASNTGSAGTEFQFLREFTNTAGQFLLSYEYTAFGEVLATDDWAPAPDNIQGVLTTPWGSLAGFTASDTTDGIGNTVHFSVPYQCHAWPAAYRKTFPEPVVALAVLGNNVLVLTGSNAYAVIGNDPANLDVDLLDAAYGCLSARGVVSIDGAIYYPTVQGLAKVSMQGIALVTEGLITDREWLASFYPSLVFAAEYRGDCVGFFNRTFASGDPRGFVYSTRTGQLSMIGDTVTLSAVHGWGGGEYLAGVVHDTLAMWQFDAHATDALTLAWKSKPFFTGADVALGAWRVFAASYPAAGSDPIVLKVYVDGVLKHTANVLSKAPGRLPDTCVGNQWQVEISSHVEVYEVQLAASFEELGA